MLVILKGTGDYVEIVKGKLWTYYYLNSKNKRKELKRHQFTFIC